MKVLHIISGLTTGGAERSLCNLFEGGLEEQIESRVVSLTDKGTFGAQIEACGVPVYSLGLKKPGGLVTAPALLRSIATEFNPDVIQGWMYHGNLAAGIARKVYSGSSALCWNIRHSLHDLKAEKLSMQYLIRLNRHFSHGADRIIYNSSVARSQHRDFGMADKNALVIANGFDIAKWKKSPEKIQGMLKSLGISENSLIVGHIGRYHPMKGHDAFIQIADKISKEFRDVQFVMIGPGVDSSSLPIPKAISRDTRERIHLLGERSDLPDLMGLLDVLCVTSWFGEGMPNVLGEAMAASVPVITTDIGDSAEIVGESGVVVRSRDTDEYAEKLSAILRMSNGERVGIGNSGRGRIEQVFSLEKMVMNYASMYQSLATQDAHRPE